MLLKILSPDGRGRRIGFAVGRVLAVLATVGAVAGLSEFATQGAGGTRVGAAVRLVLGVVFVLLALSKLRSRPKDGAGTETPGWMRALDGMPPARALRTGFLLTYTAIATTTVVMPVTAYLILGAPVRAVLEPVRTWLIRYYNIITAAVLAIIGAVMIGKGLAGL